MFRGNTTRDQLRGRGQSRGAPNSSSNAGSHAFEQERRENEAKRQQRGNTAGVENRRGRGGRGGSSRGGLTMQSSRRDDGGRSSKESSPAPTNAFGKPKSRTTSPAPTTTNSFAPKPNPIASSNPFGASGNTMSSPFGAPTQSAPTDLFGGPSSSATTSVFGAQSSTQHFNPFGTPATSEGVKSSVTNNPFGMSSTPSVAVPESSLSTASALPMSKKFGPQGLDPFAKTSPKPTPTFGAASKPLTSFNNLPNTFGAPTQVKQSSSSAATTTAPFGDPNAGVFGSMSTPPVSSTTATFGSSNFTNTAIKKIGTSSTSITNGTSPKTAGQAKANSSAVQKTSKPPRNAWSEWSQKLANHLKKEGIVRPTYPGNVGDPSESAKLDNFFRGPLRKYRERVRKSFMSVNLMDDPDKPKKLSDAIDFKGTCEDMCPFKECFERIMEGPSGVSFLEKERIPTGDLWPSLDKMVKKHSRSAAGDEEPLPEDIRSPATLSRTVDYLMNTILSSDEDLPKVHGFLWDRTRAIRRDFIFQQAAMSNGQMDDLVYCLEHIIRFHILALHQMSKAGIADSEYNEQQELEQLQKAMISLTHAYGDCAAQNIPCENEAEFRAYNLVLFAETPRVLDGLAQVKSRLGKDSKQFNAGVAIVECLRTCWEKSGPLKSFHFKEKANNPFCKFFSIISGDQTWYLLACFAEIHFYNVRKAALKHILKEFRQDGSQTQDFTLANLQSTLSFDTSEEIVTFGEKHGLKFEGTDGENRLSLQSTRLIIAPHPRPRQVHSLKNVEVKRGYLSLSEIIDGVVNQDHQEVGQHEAPIANSNEVKIVSQTADGDFDIDLTTPEEEEDLFVRDNTIPVNPQSEANPTFQSAPEKKAEQPQPFSFGGQSALQSFGKPAPSVFDQVKTVQSFDSGFFTQGMTGNSSKSSNAPAKPITQIPSISFPPALAAPASFFQPPPAKSVEESIKPPPTLGNYTITRAPTVDPTGISFGGFSASKPSTPTVDTTAGNTLPNTSVMQQNLPSASFGAQLPLPTAASTATSAPIIQQASQPTTQPVAAPILPAPTPFAPSIPPTNQQLVPFGQVDSLVAHSVPPIPASNVIQASPTSSGVVVRHPSAPATPQISVEALRETFIENTSTWFAIGTDGVLPQFAEFMVEGLLENVFREFKAEEAAQTARRELDAANRLADEHRHQVVATKFLARWSHIAHIRWVRRQAVAARQLRKEMFEASRAKKVAESAALVEDFRTSTRSNRGKEKNVGNALVATEALNGFHDRSSSIRNIVNSPKERRRTTQTSDPSQRKQSVNGTKSVNRMDVKRTTGSLLSHSRNIKSTTDNPLRRSLLDHPSYLNGDSRIFFAKNWTDEDERRERPSGTQTDYFRLKARGIHTMYDGTPLASSVASLIKQSHDSEPLSDPRRRSTNSYGRSTSSRPSRTSQSPVTRVDLGGLKANARDFVEQDRISRKRRSVVEDDEQDAGQVSRVKRFKDQLADDREESRKSQSLDVEEDQELEKRRSMLNFTEEELKILDRSRRVKEQMDEGVVWYQDQIEKDSQREESRGRSRTSFGYRP